MHAMTTGAGPDSTPAGRPYAAELAAEREGWYQVERLIRSRAIVDPDSLADASVAIDEVGGAATAA